MVLVGWGGGVRAKFPAVEHVIHSIRGFNSQSSERVSEGDRAAVFTRTYLEPNVINALRKSISQDTVTNVKQ